MEKSYQICCPKCNNNQNFSRYGKDKEGFQKYLCHGCNHQFAPDRPRAGAGQTGARQYPSCPRCGRASFIHHDYELYTNYRCCDKKCNHSFCVVKGTAVAEASMWELFGKTSFKRMRYPVFVIITALTMFYLGKSSFRNISLILRIAFNIKVSHTTISNWCTNFAPMFDNMRLKLLPMGRPLSASIKEMCPRTYTMIRRGVLNPAQFVTHTAYFEDVPAMTNMFDRACDKEDSYMKGVILFTK